MIGTKILGINGDMVGDWIGYNDINGT